MLQPAGFCPGSKHLRPSSPDFVRPCASWKIQSELSRRHYSHPCPSVVTVLAITTQPGLSLLCMSVVLKPVCIWMVYLFRIKVYLFSFHPCVPDGRAEPWLLPTFLYSLALDCTARLPVGAPYREAAMFQWIPFEVIALPNCQ